MRPWCCPIWSSWAALFFCLAALSRRMLPVYIGSVLLLFGYLAAQGLLRDMENKFTAAMLDPFGVVATSRLTEYWSISERNTRLIPFEGLLLWNRLLWLAHRRRDHRVLHLAVRASRIRVIAAGSRGGASVLEDAAPTRRSRCPTVEPAARRGVASAAADDLAQLPRDGEERLLRRHRAGGNPVLHRHQHDRPARSSARPRGRSPTRCWSSCPARSDCSCS